MRHAQSPILTVMIKAAEKAGRALLRDFNEVENLQVSRKGPADFVSAADKKSEKILKEELEYARPKFSFLLEEGGVIKGEDPDHTWIIDPLDGTLNFLHGIPHWAISIACKRKDEIISALVYDPVKNDMFTAEKGAGAFSKSTRLRVSKKDRPIDALIAHSGTEALTYINKTPAIKYRNMGSASLHMAYLAAGKFDALLMKKLPLWDIAAGSLIIKEAGGFVSDFDNGRNILSDPKELVAANPSLHGELLRMIREKGQN